MNKVSAKLFNIEKSENSIIKERINLISGHMYKQYAEHIQATSNTNKIYNKILNEMSGVAESLKQSFEYKNVPTSNIFCEIDADRSVGIMNILWHSISFTTRGNSKPLALFREGQIPLFTGRILALHGDFQDASLDIMDQQYPDILECEIASLYVPADITTDAIIKIKHLGNREFPINQADAPREFLLKVIEIICGGGIYHEQDSDIEEE